MTKVTGMLVLTAAVLVAILGSLETNCCNKAAESLVHVAKIKSGQLSTFM